MLCQECEQLQSLQQQRHRQSCAVKSAVNQNNSGNGRKHATAGLKAMELEHELAIKQTVTDGARVSVVDLIALHCIAPIQTFGIAFAEATHLMELDQR